MLFGQCWELLYVFANTILGSIYLNEHRPYNRSPAPPRPPRSSELHRSILCIEIHFTVLLTLPYMYTENEPLANEALEIEPVRLKMVSYVRRAIATTSPDPEPYIEALEL